MFITLEGPDGSGKTSQVAPLVEFLQNQGLPVLALREPGGTEISEQVRQVIMTLKNTGMNPRTEILLFLAARAQLVAEVIRPALEQGRLILCDRYADSTLAYQGYGHGVDLDILRSMLDFATGRLYPDLTLLLDIETEAGLHRKRRAGGEWNRLDAYDVDFHRRVRQGYFELAASEPERWVMIDASQPPEVVQSAMRQAIMTRIRA